jgi:hypothetical protein
VFRCGFGELREVLVGTGSITLSSRRTGTAFGPPLRLENDVYVTADGRLRCLLMPNFTDAWSADRADCRGAPSVRGDFVYVLCGSPDKLAVLARSRRDGTAAGECEAFPAGGGDEPGTIVVGDDRLAVCCAAPLRGQGGNGNLVTMPMPLPAMQPLAGLRLYASYAAPAVAARSWQLPIVQQGSPQLGLDPPGIVLATAASHEAWLQAGVEPSVAGGVLLMGGGAADLETRRVLWQNGRAPRSRAIPARDAVLHTDGARLLAFRACAPDRDASTAEDLLASVHEERLGAHLRQITDAAFAARDLQLVDDVLHRAYLAGMDAKWLDEQQRRRINAARVGGKPDARKSGAVRTRLDAFAAAVVDDVWQTIRAGTPAPAVADALLDFVLARRADHPGAAAAVAERLPAELQAFIRPAAAQRTRRRTRLRRRPHAPTSPTGSRTRASPRRWRSRSSRRTRPISAARPPIRTSCSSSGSAGART